MELKSRFTFVVFDLDGTLLDSLPATFQAMSHALSPRLGRSLELRDLVHHMGRTDTELLRFMIGQAVYPETLRDYLDFYQERPDLIRMFPGVAELLKSIRARQVRSAVITGRGRASLDILLQHTGIQQCVDLVIAADDGLPAKPDPGSVFHAAQALGVEARGGLMVGDGPDDIRCGRAAGMVTVAARWSELIPLAQITEAGPDHIVHSLAELATFLGI